MSLRTKPRAALVHARRLARAAAAPVRTELDLVRSRNGPAADLALFHDFAPPPTGGGHQFLRALLRELRSRALEVEENRISPGTAACLLNSFTFDMRRLRRFARARRARLVHRVDGPIGVYRGYDDGTDLRILEINRAVAAATVFQSSYSLARHLELGLELRDPVVIPNAVDPEVFHPPAEREPTDGRRVRVVATSWSDNPRKGAQALVALDSTFDADRFEVTFVGRTATSFRRIRTIDAVPSAALADILRSQDVYLAPSHDDPCSNALLEALACGLPAVFRRSGGHPELVGEAGVGFDDDEELPAALERLAGELEARRAVIRVPALADVADRYLEVLAE